MTNVSNLPKVSNLTDAEFQRKRWSLLQAVLRPNRLTRIVDVGANPAARAPYKSLLDSGFCEVWGFEPHPQAFDRLKQKSGPLEHYLPHAVGDGSETTFNLCARDSFSSCLAPAPAFFQAFGVFESAMRVVNSCLVTTRRIDDLPDVPEFDLLKIDVQGAELMVFEGARRKLLSALAVVTEVAVVPLYVGQPLLDRQMRHLSDLGYSFHRMLFLKHVMPRGAYLDRLDPEFHRCQAIDGDAVFIRSLMSRDTLETEQLKHNVILADAVFQSYALAVLFMRDLVARETISVEDLHVYIDHLPGVKARH